MTTTKTQIEEVWHIASKHLQDNPLTGDSLHLRRLETSRYCPIYIGMDSENRRLFAIGIATRPPRLDVQSDSFDYHTSERTDKSWLMILRLVDGSLTDVFSTLCGDLYDELHKISDEQLIIKEVGERLISWQKLFEIARKGALSPSQVRGLFAELLALRELIEEAPYDSRTIITSWNGPYGSDQDFQLPDINIEIKCIGQDATFLRISSLQQLDSDKKLYLYVINVQSSNEPYALSLNDLISNIEGLLANDVITLKIFRSALFTLGLFQDEHYDEPKYWSDKRFIYEVNSEFPKLTNSTVPRGIERVEYSIKIKELSPFTKTKIVYGNY